MSNMRRLIELMEAANPDERLTGPVNAPNLAAMLPLVNDIRFFTSAIAKLKRGDDDSLTIKEKDQLARAFISILRDDREDKMRLMKRLMLIKAQNADQ